MEFEEFMTVVQETVENKMGADQYTEILEIPKNNGTVLTGLRIRKEPEGLMPTIHMEPYYDRFKHGMEIEDIAADIIGVFQAAETGKEIQVRDMLDFNKMKEKVVFRVVNTEKNRQMLETIPSIPWLDLSVVFYLLLKSDVGGQMTTVVSNEHMEAWGITAEELYCVAHKNTKHLLPTRIRHMSEVMAELLEHMEEEFGVDEDIKEMLCSQTAMPMYVMSNNTGMYGSCCMLPSLGIEEFACEKEADLVVMPSSIHEVILVPVKGVIDYTELSEVVRGINEREVPVEDQLSDGIYYYSRASGMKRVNCSKNIAQEAYMQEV